MARKMSFAALEQAVEELAEKRTSRWSRHEANQTVQMSVRMSASDYDRFRALCMKERLTNGEMLKELLEDHFSRLREEASGQ